MINNIVSLELDIFRLYTEALLIEQGFCKGTDGNDINYHLEGSKCTFFVQERQHEGAVHASIMHCSIPSKYRLIPYNYAKEFDLRETVQELWELGITECSGLTVYGRGSLVGKLSEEWVKLENCDNLWMYKDIDSRVYFYQENGYYKLVNENKGNISYLLNEVTEMYQEKHNDKDSLNNSSNNEVNKESKAIVEDDNADDSEKMFTKVIGLGTEKSKSDIEKLEEGDIVKLLREPNNIYDKDAIAVYNIYNEKIGYIARDDEKELAEFMNGETEHEASVTRKNDGNGLSYGANIQVTKVDIGPNINSNCDVQKFIQIISDYWEKQNSNQVESNIYSLYDRPQISIANKVNKIVDDLKKERGLDVLLNTWQDVSLEVRRKFTSKEQIKTLEELIRKNKELEDEYWKDIAEQDDGYGDYLASQYDGYGNRVNSKSSDPDYWGGKELNYYYGYEEDYDGDWD